MLVWLSVWSKVQTCIWPSCCHCHSLSLTSVKSRLVSPFWYRLTWVVPEKGPLNGCVCVISIQVDGLVNGVCILLWISEHRRLRILFSCSNCKEHYSYFSIFLLPHHFLKFSFLMLFCWFMHKLFMYIRVLVFFVLHQLAYFVSFSNQITRNYNLDFAWTITAVILCSWMSSFAVSW